MALAAAARGATILERSVDIAIEGDAVTTTEELLVAIEERGDADTWSVYPIYLDDRSELRSCVAEVRDGSGKLLDKVPERRHERIDSPGYDAYNSSYLRLVPFPPLQPGQRLHIVVVVRERPYFPSTFVYLRHRAPQKKLRVSVHGGGAELRIHLCDRSGLFHMEEGKDGLVLSQRDVPGPDPGGLATGLDATASALRVAWGGGKTWAAIGSWYETLCHAPRAPSAEVEKLARELTAGTTSPRRKVEALATHVKRRLRYEAVEIGAGGYVPAPAAAVLARSWGDCKDKAEVLSELLRASDIPSHLALLHAGREGRVDEAFPSPDQFNHCIVAIPAEAAGAAQDDPVVDGLLFIDATSDRGGVGWLSPFSQGGPALIVDGDHSRLVAIPDRFRQERRGLEVTGRIDADGTLHAHVAIDMAGEEGAAWMERIAREPASRVEDGIRGLVDEILPGARVARGAFRQEDGATPAVALEADAELPSALHGAAGSSWLFARALTALPESRLLDGRALPVVLDAGTSTTRYRLELPPGSCPPAPIDEAVENGLGRVTLRVRRGDDGALVIERAAEVRHSFIEPDLFDALRALCVAESRAEKTRVVLRCP